jgi:gliding motility-associated-like protein
MFFLLGGLLLNLAPLKADHLMGSDITWKCLGSDTFLITVTVYRDCNGISMPGQSFDITCGDKKGGGTITSISTTQSKGKDITPVCKKSCSKCGKVVNTAYGDPKCKFPYGIELYTFTAKVIFAKQSGFKGCCNAKISWEQCCRSGTLTCGGNWQNFHVEATINRCAKPNCDNSPVFRNPPIAIICKGQCFSYNPGMTDPDVNSNGEADSLVYSIVKPLTGTGAFVTYTGNYTYDKPLLFDSFPKKNALWNPPSCSGFHLDSFNGDLQFKPTKVEQTVMAIQVQEYTKDPTTGKPVLKGTTRRDIQLIIMACPSNHVPTLTGIDGTNYNDYDVCANNLACFTINSNDVDNDDTVSVDWNNALASLGATFKTEKLKKHPRSTFCWKPTSAQVRTYPYQFVVTAQDDACPLNGRTQRSFRIHVHASPEGTVNFVDNGCGNFTFTLLPKAGTKYDASTIVWSGDDGLGGTGLTTKHHYRLASKNTGDVRRVTVSFAAKFASPLGIKTCPTILDTHVYIKPFVQVTLPHDTTICKATAGNIVMRPIVTGGKLPYTYLWSTGPKDTTSTLNVKVTGDATYYVKVTDNGGLGCTNADTIHIHALVPAKPDLGLPQRHCDGETVILQDNSTHDSMGYYWYNAANISARISDSSSALVKDSGVYVLRLNDAKLRTCYNADSVAINFNLPVKVISQTVQACSNTSVTLDAGMGKGDPNANWQWRDLYNQSRILYRGRTVTLVPKQDIHFYVTSSQTYKGVACQDSGTIHVYLNPLPPNKTTPIGDQCFNNPALDLSIYTTTPGGVWTVDTATPKNALSKGHFYPDSAGLGNHTITYTTTDVTTGCKNIHNNNIKIDTLPKVLLKPDTYVCIDSVKSFDLSKLVYGPSGGTWSGPAVSNNRYFNQGDPQAGGDGVKTFTYTVVDKVNASHCAGKASVKIDVLRALAAHGGPDLDACRKYSVPVPLPSGDGKFNATWYRDSLTSSNTPAGAIKNVGGEYTFYPDIADTGVHILIFELSHDGHRCPKRDTVIFTVHPNPPVTISLVPNLCVASGAYKLNGTPKGGYFTLMNGNSSALSSPYFFPGTAGPGQYRVKYTYQDKNTCFDTFSTVVTVTDTPSVQIGPPPVACSGAGQLKLTATKSNGAGQLVWVSSDKTAKFIYDNATDPEHLNPSYVIGADTSFTVTVHPDSLKITPPTSCALPYPSIQINLNPKPVVRFTANTVTGCTPLVVNFKDMSSVAGGTPTAWVWNFGDGTSSTDANPVHTYTKDTTQTYSVSLTVTSNNNCTGFYPLKNYIQVYATPRPWFDAIPFYTTITAPDINFTDLSTINDKQGPGGENLVHRWDFGDGSQSEVKGNVTHSYSDTGFYTVKLYVRNPLFNCEAETARVNYIDIRPELIVFIPNAFSPNRLFNERTIVNEKFSPVISNFSAYHMQIFSRWGELLYDTRDITKGWDGSYLGKMVQEDVYIYKVEASSLEGKKFKYSGSVTLLK